MLKVSHDLAVVKHCCATIHFGVICSLDYLNRSRGAPDRSGFIVMQANHDVHHSCKLQGDNFYVNTVILTRYYSYHHSYVEVVDMGKYLMAF